jgi:hypothetical protein
VFVEITITPLSSNTHRWNLRVRMHTKQQREGGGERRPACQSVRRTAVFVEIARMPPSTNAYCWNLQAGLRRMQGQEGRGGGRGGGSA